MREHHSGVASGTQHCRPGHGPRGFWKRSVAERSESVGDGTQRQGEVGPGVSIGNREDVDPVDLLSAGGNPLRCGED
jgi:hypothetical protein